MANLGNLKKPKKNRFGAPPSEDEAGDNLSAPETATPSKPVPVLKKEKKPRIARRTGRTVPFGTRVSPEFLKAFKRTAFDDELKLVELLEASLAAYLRERDS
jgi:hypothetical protein